MGQICTVSLLSRGRWQWATTHTLRRYSTAARRTYAVEIAGAVEVKVGCPVAGGTTVAQHLRGPDFATVWGQFKYRAETAIGGAVQIALGIQDQTVLRTASDIIESGKAVQDLLSPNPPDSGDNSKTAPESKLAPPPEVVPYRFPEVSKTRLPIGVLPSFEPLAPKL